MMAAWCATTTTPCSTAATAGASNLFGELVVDRPAPGATEPRLAPDRWTGAAVYHRGSGWWRADGTPLAETGHSITIGGVAMEVRPTPSGQVGLFPEQAANLAWLQAAVRARCAVSGPAAEPPNVLNLFAYTGLATLVVARAGGGVTHVDASKPSVLWARRNAELSDLAEAPIRWIVDEALAFVRREARRGRRYAGLILDPPSYGHAGRGGSGGTWRFDERVGELLDACAGIAAAGCLLAPDRAHPGLGSAAAWRRRFTRRPRRRGMRSRASRSS